MTTYHVQPRHNFGRPKQHSRSIFIHLQSDSRRYRERLPSKQNVRHELAFSQIWKNFGGKCLRAHQYIEFCTNLFTINLARQTENPTNIKGMTQSENEYGRSCIPFLQSFPSKNELQDSSVVGGSEVKRISMTKRRE